MGPVGRRHQLARRTSHPAAVVTRKVCGGNRTRKGADTQQILASVVRTARQRNLDLPALFATMLRAPDAIAPDVFGLPPPAASSAVPERAH